MATWKKVLVSGSNISELVNDSNYLLTIGDNVVSSSAQVTLGGDLTGTAANAQLAAGVVTNTEVAAGAGIEYTKISFAGSTILSGSVVTDLSSSLAARLTTDETNIATNTSNISTNSASFATFSGSYSTRITADETNISNLLAWSSSLDAGFVSEAELSAYSASVAARNTADEAALSNFSSSIAARVTSDETNLSNISSSFATRLTADEVKYNAYTSSFATTTLNVLGNAAVTGAFGVVGPVTLQDSLLVQGDLTVNGTVTTFNTTNLAVEDKFITLASGSNTLADAGIIFQSDANGSGPALYLEATSTGTYGRMAMATSVNGTSTTATPAAYVNTTEVGAGAPPLAPTFGDTTNGSGNMYVNALTGDIFIYA